VLNNRDSEVWAFLALLCLMQDRQFEANQSISQAIRLGIRDADVLRYVTTTPTSTPTSTSPSTPHVIISSLGIETHMTYLCCDF
jgi:hypothetical protein